MPDQHSRFNPSGMGMYLGCHYSAQHSHKYPNSTSEYAEEGTMLHTEAEKAIIRNSAPEHDFLKVYVDYCIKLKDLSKWSVEKRLKYNDDVWGTIDFIAWNDDELWVVDLKTGQGVSVYPDNNTQLMTYAGMALTKQKVVNLVIVQPRLDNPVREWQTDADTIRKHMKRVDEMQQAVIQGSETASSGSHCRWCKCKIDCPLAKQSLVTINESDRDIAELLQAADLAEELIKSIRARAYELADGGTEVKGYKLVNKRATKKWKKGSEEKLKEIVDNVDTMYDTKLKSPAQLEKATKLDLAEYYEAKSSGTVLVPESDKRPAVFSAKNLGNLANKLKSIA